MKKLILMVLIFIELALCTMPILAVNLSGKSSNVKLNNNIKVDLKEIGELTNFTPETLDSFKYKINEYEAIVIVDSAKVNNSKDEFFTTLNLGQVVQVYGIYNNDTNRVVIGWENGFGTVNQKDLNDITGVKLDTLEDLDYIGDTYKAKIGIYGALLKNSKAQEIIYIPTEKVIDVYGFWAEDNSKLVVKYNGLYGITTNLINDTETIVKVMNGKWEIEESFRIMKDEFDSGTVHLSREDRIKGHFITCYLALFIYRYLEHKLDDKYTVHEIVAKLQEMKMLEHKGKGYEPIQTRNNLTDDLHQ